MAPGHPIPRLALAAESVDIGSGNVPAGARRDAIDALALAPLADEPFMIAALAAIGAGRTGEGESMLEEARRRNPRLRPARLFLLERYLRSNRAEDAALEISALRRLIPGVAEALAPQLAQMVRDRQSGGALLRIIRHDPGLQQAVLSNLASHGADPDLIMDIAAASPATAPTANGLPWQRQLIGSLVERGDLARALRLWRSFAGLPAASDEKAVYDGRFQNLPGSGPFNWTLYEGSAGVSQHTRGPALDVQYYGRETVDLAAQLMVLKPGRYRLRFRVEGAAKGDDSRLAWRVVCRGSTQPLIELSLRDVTAAPRIMAADFTVPASCTGQWLRLAGVAGEFPGTQTAMIGDVAVVQAGAN